MKFQNLIQTVKLYWLQESINCQWNLTPYIPARSSRECIGVYLYPYRISLVSFKLMFLHCTSTLLNAHKHTDIRNIGMYTCTDTPDDEKKNNNNNGPTNLKCLYTRLFVAACRCPSFFLFPPSYFAQICWGLNLNLLMSLARVCVCWC